MLKRVLGGYPRVTRQEPTGLRVWVLGIGYEPDPRVRVLKLDPNPTQSEVYTRYTRYLNISNRNKNHKLLCAQTLILGLLVLSKHALCVRALAVVLRTALITPLWPL